ncbi:RHS repeat-associated core domain-containing protein [Streptacidiphilus sp. N1-10]|uniref:RHS repeat-associated core domain-containing protein n=1 Tax=Streptacidiphilus jeojiensis TaxID=3229225 RepID=A0ABV6XQ35_9ACTN
MASALAVLAGLLSPWSIAAASAATDPNTVWTPPNTPLTNVASVPVHTAAKPTTASPKHSVPSPWAGPTAVTALASGTTTVTVPASVAAKSNPLAAAQSSGGGAQSKPTGASVRAGNLPVWLAPPSTTSSQAKNTKAKAAAPASGAVQVSVADSAHTAAAGSHGVLLSLKPSATAAGGRVQVGVDLSSLSSRYGADVAQRSRLVELPACSLTTPQVKGCLAQTPVASHYDAATGRLVADVTLPTSTTATTASAATPTARSAAVSASQVMVLDSTPTSAGGAGTYAATSLQNSSKWAAGSSSGGFTYSYGINTPPALAGAAPQVSLAYDSSSVDGRTSSQNSQSSEIGDGWSLAAGGFIERSYQSCDKDGITNSADECWGGYNATMNLAGHSGQLVRDDTSNPKNDPATATSYHLQDDDGTTITFQGGASNGAWNGESVTVTDTTGMTYYFGTDHLPGDTGSPNSNSAWTVPVYSPNSGDPCYDSTKGAASWCQMAWRWNLDAVVDPHGNLTTYSYTPETDTYARGGGQNLGTGTLTSYTRGGVLHTINYGQTLTAQVDANGTAKSAAQITFTPDAAGRCSTDGGYTCTGATLGTGNASHWPDVPYDQHCASTGTCTNYGPSFWSNQKITTISTQVLSAGAYTDVDSYALAQSFQTPGDGTDPTLWLDSITHTGKDGGSLSEPPVIFTAQMLPNRVDGTNLVPSPPAFYRPRIQQIVTETGETINVDYNLPDCSRVHSVMPASPDSDTMDCYSVVWYPPGTAVGAPPAQDWFNHYTVASVTAHDSVADSPERDTTYTYGPAAWHRNEAENIDPKTRTWDDFRGFAWVTQVTGATTDSTGPQSQTTTHYLQGMDGDLNADGTTKHVQVNDSLGESVTDDDWLAGSTLETDTYTQASATPSLASYTVTRQINPYTTVTHKRSGASDLVARYIATTTKSTTKSLKADGSWRTGTSTTISDPLNHNRTISQEAVSDGLPEQCTYTSYATGGPGDLPDQTETLSGLSSCDAAHPVAATAANLVSAKRTLYDSQAFGTAGSLGDATGVQSADHFDTSGNLVYATTATSGYDTMGRLVSATDPNATDSAHPNGSTTITTFSSANAGELPNKITTASPVPGSSTSTWTATKTLDPARGLTLTSTDQNARTTTASYDALGRTTAVWQPGRTTSQPPSTLYSYTDAHVKDPAKTGDVAVPATVTTKNLRVDNGGVTANSTYLGSIQIMNGFGEVRQVQANSTVSLSADRLISDTLYDSHGRAYETNDPLYNNASGPTGTLVAAPVADLPSMTSLSFDGQGRTLTSSFYSLGQLQSTTGTTYKGVDETDVTPPKGATPTTTISDGAGRTSQLWQYHTATATGNKADADVTSYTYTPTGKPATQSDATGKNTWSYSYDLYGRQTKATDPDTGTTTTSYTPEGQIASTTDARGQILAYTYDLLGRKTGEYNGTVAASKQIAAWTYDTATGGLGQPASSTRYVGGATGDAYTTTVRGYNNNYQSTGSTVSVPGKLVGQAAGTTYSYVTLNYYDTVTGQQTGVHLPAAGGSPTETVTNSYDVFGKLASQVGASTYDLQTTYDNYGRPTRTTLNPWSKEVVATYNYDQATGRVLDSYLDYQAATQGAVDQNDYTYSPSGQVTSITNIPNNTPASTDRQCFTYDYLGRLTTAWTDTGTTTTAPQPSIADIGGCTNTTPTSGAAAGKTTVGGPAAYWTSYTYDTTGNRTSQTQHNTTGDTTKDTTTTQTFPAAGQANTPTAATGTGGGTGGPHALLGASTKTGTATPVTSAYQYDAAGNTTAITTGSSSTTMTWDAEGRLASDKPAGATNATTYVYDTDGNLLTRTTGTTTTLFLGPDELTYNGTAVSGTRYYSEPNGLTIVRQGTTETFQSTDPHGTATVAIDANTGTQTRRYLDPFGNPRGTAPTTWAGDKGFVGGIQDPATGLTNLGAREYQPTTGRFLNPDPQFNTADPQSWNSYAYSDNQPPNLSDPTGLATACEDSCQPHVDPTTGQEVDNQDDVNGHVHTHHPKTDQTHYCLSECQAARAAESFRSAIAAATAAAAQARLDEELKLQAEVLAYEQSLQNTDSRHWWDTVANYGSAILHNATSIGVDLVALGFGVGSTGDGVLMMGGGGIACATGLGCLGGAPAIAGGVVVTGAGIGLTTVATKHLSDDIGTALSEAKDSGASGAAPKAADLLPKADKSWQNNPNFKNRNQFGREVWANGDDNYNLVNAAQAKKIVNLGVTKEEIENWREVYAAQDLEALERGNMNPSARQRAELMQYYLDNWNGVNG